MFGDGLFHGQLVAGNFVPSQQTDFIFTVAGEELGFVGAIAIVVLLGIVVARALRIAARADDLFGTLIASGVAVWFAFQSFVNIGMTIGIMPDHRPAAAVRLLRRLGRIRRHDRHRHAPVRPPPPQRLRVAGRVFEQAAASGRPGPRAYVVGAKMIVVTFLSPIPATLMPGNWSSESMVPLNP